MKIACVVFLVACVYAHGAVRYPAREDNEPLQLRILPTQIHTTTVGVQNTADDELLASELALLNNQQRNLIEDQIANLLEGFRDVVINGNENIPPLDPVELQQIGPFSYSSNGIRVTGYINDLHADGLRWYIVDEVTFNALRLALGVRVTLPWLRVNGSYDANARILLLRHDAGGNFRVFVNRVEVSVDLRVGTNILAGHLVLRELDIKIDIHDTLIQIDGLVGSPVLNNIISGLVQSITQAVIQNELEKVSQMLSEQLFDTINEVLKDYTIADILG
ncbi:uncharacterized protein LOC128670065 [Plodia interpunctella]|uniref:uncharacterized protein LOC128670065 n=1 Tax=Plodia interpunctella TaxID=58824 RepID=UPI002367EC3C|nr:uncharacterized protein LOC128670065 [Plodia interpunctella]